MTTKASEAHRLKAIREGLSPQFPWNLGDWERIVRERAKALADVKADRSPVAACDVGLRFRAEDWAREALHRAEMELVYARSRCQCTMVHWDGAKDECHLVGITDGVATVRYADGTEQTMDSKEFWLCVGDTSRSMR